MKKFDETRLSTLGKIIRNEMSKQNISVNQLTNAIKIRRNVFYLMCNSKIKYMRLYAVLLVFEYLKLDTKIILEIGKQENDYTCNDEYKNHARKTDKK